MEAVREGHSVHLGARLPQVVLAILAAQAPQTVTRDALIDQVWPDGPPATATNVLQIYISQLRKAIGRDRIRTRSSGYALHLDEHDEFDVWRFAELVAAGTSELDAGDPSRAAETLGRALSLW